MTFEGSMNKSFDSAINQPVNRRCKVQYGLLLVVIVTVSIWLNWTVRPVEIEQIPFDKAQHIQHKTPVDHKDSHSIYYLKVHKTGSTTFSSILTRFGLSRNFSFAKFKYNHPFPTYNMVDFLIPHPEDLMQNTNFEHKFNIVNVHSVFNKTAIYTFMPNDTKLVATMRHPFSQLKSAFNHYNLKAHLNIPNSEDPFLEFLKHPRKYDKLLPGSMYNKISDFTGIKLSFTRNRMAFEFGFDLTKEGNATYVQEHLQHVVDSFDIVLITEYYDESLLLLRELFSWDYKDILYLMLREKSYKGKNKRYDDFYESHKQWAPLDYLVYKHFLEIHRRKVASKGPEFKDEVNYFQQVLQKVLDFCTQLCNTDSELVQQLVIGGSVYHSGFNVSRSDCKLMQQYHCRKYIQDYQYRNYCKRYSQSNSVRHQQYVKHVCQKHKTYSGNGTLSDYVQSKISLSC